ncbi:MAG: hypothetical protein FRX48_06700 [Lasallia pustulata]|uniref:Uncharacterized protein n=1 Tax=Lasallia pustulata TaxID=136370 RepID=A0A5M8PIJ7_9LECA|nr:MAG: hypothetical protein FRX48_06700 [Lasallia pustulata]
MPPPSAASFPFTFAAQSTQGTRIDLSTPDDHRVVVKLDPTYIDHYRTLTPSALRDRVASHIHAATDPNITSLQQGGGDNPWSHCPWNPGEQHPNGRPKADHSPHPGREPQIGNEKDIPISYVGWLCVPKRAAGSMVVEFTDAEQANAALQTCLIWDSEYKKTELYDRARRTQECFRCHKGLPLQKPGEEEVRELWRSTQSPRQQVPGVSERSDTRAGGTQHETDPMEGTDCKHSGSVFSSSLHHPISPIPSSAPQAGAYTSTNINNPTRTGANAAPSKASVVRGLQKTPAPALATPKPGSTLNTNGKRPASATITGSNHTPLGAISNNGRAKRSVTKSLEQQSMDADAELEGNQRGVAMSREEASRSAESASAPENRESEETQRQNLWAVNIYVYNQAAIRASANLGRQSGQYLLKEIVQVIDRLRGAGIRVQIHWIPAHVGVPGNEEADIAAKTAAQGSRTYSREVFYMLATCKQKLRKRVFRRWAKEWENGATGRTIFHLEKELNLGVLTKHTGIRRPLSSLITQLRTGKIALAHYLHRIQRRDSPRCPCSQGIQTVRHILTECPRTQNLREELLGRAHDIRRTLKDSALVKAAAILVLQGNLMGQFQM